MGAEDITVGEVLDDNDSVEETVDLVDEVAEESTEETEEETDEATEETETEDTAEENEDSEEETDVVDEDWDADEEESETEEATESETADEPGVTDAPPADFDWTGVSAEIGLNVSSREELVREVKGLKEKASSYNQAFLSPQERSTLAEMRGNIQGLDRIAPLDLVRYYLQLPTKDENGKQVPSVFTTDDIDDFISKKGWDDLEDKTNQIELQSEVDRIKDKLTTKFNKNITEIQNKKELAKAHYSKSVEVAANGLNDVYGFKLKENRKEEIKSALNSDMVTVELPKGVLEKLVPLTKNGKLDISSLAANFAKLTMGDKMMKAAKSKAAAKNFDDNTRSKPGSANRRSSKTTNPKARKAGDPVVVGEVVDD